MVRKRIAWFIPFPSKGSGGHRTIFAHVQNLVDCGHDCHVYIGHGGNRRQMQSEYLQDLVNTFYGQCEAQFFPGYTTEKQYDMAIATVWWTAFVVAQEIDAKCKVYFIQDYEPWFYPMGDKYILSRNSYRLGLVPVTIGRWLSWLMSNKYNTPSAFFEFTADRNIYHPLDYVEKEKAVCFVYQPEKPRRCPVIGGEVLEIVKQHRPEVTIYTYGATVDPSFYFDHQHLGLLSFAECNELYNKCLVGLCLSSSNPSRIPFEMMAAGCPVVEIFGDNTRFDLPDQGTLLAEQTPSSIASAIIRIVDSESLQESLSAGAIEFMHARNANLEFKQFAYIVDLLLSGKNFVQQPLENLYRAPPLRSDQYVLNKDLRDRIQPIKKNIIARAVGRVKRAVSVLMRGYY